MKYFYVLSPRMDDSNLEERFIRTENEADLEANIRTLLTEQLEIHIREMEPEEIEEPLDSENWEEI